MRLISCLIIGLCLTAQVYAQSKKIVTDLPDISVIGNFLGSYSKSNKSFDVKELEFSFQHYLYPSVKANVFAALHKEASGDRNFELEEAYVTFSDMWGVVFIESDSNVGLGTIVGKKLLNIGKINALHPEQLTFVDRSFATQQFLGGEEGLSAEGGAFQYLMPLPFFSQLELGYWTVAPHEENETIEHSGVEYTNRLFNTRLWNSFNLSDTQELELGFSSVIGNTSTSSESDKQSLYVIDLTHTKELLRDRLVIFQAEHYQAKYGESGEERASQSGGFLSGFYKPSKHYQFGLRHGWLGKHGDEGDTQNGWAILATRQLTETSKFRIQYNTGDGTENTFLAQFIFGIGPHSHVLQ
ncbi:hypothetical protein DID80_01380 [Candidatus Marinamargulisbacteria bacterium SCGC AAA071-K20]|nr:hypothetical protein DID80_01380 [Candidatus Marinamargulisbacteria bacterium SCGC AAA071-K20]